MCACVDGGRWGENEHPPGGALLCAQEFCRDGASRRATSPSLQVGRRRRRPARSAAKGGRRQAANAGYWGAGTRCHTVPYRLVWAPAVSSPRTRRGWKGMEVTPHTHHEPEGLRAPPETAHASRSAAFVEGRCVSVMIPLCCNRREDQGEDTKVRAPRPGRHPVRGGGGQKLDALLGHPGKQTRIGGRLTLALLGRERLVGSRKRARGRGAGVVVTGVATAGHPGGATATAGEGLNGCCRTWLLTVLKRLPPAARKPRGRHGRATPSPSSPHPNDALSDASALVPPS